MKQEFLKSLGISDEETIHKILDENSNDIGKVKKDADVLRSQLTDVQTQLKSFDGVDVSSMKSQIETLNKTIADNKNTFEKQLADRDFNDKVTSIAAEYKPKNMKTVMPLLDLEKLRVSKDQEKDIRAEFTEVKKANGWLFDDDSHKPMFTGGTSGIHTPEKLPVDNHNAVNDAIRSVFGQKENS